MALELDDRQRAMLQEMGVQVWLPGTAFAPTAAPSPTAAAPVVPTPAPTPASRPLPGPPPPRAPATVAAAMAAPPAQHRSAPALVTAVDTLDWAALAQAAAACQACGLCESRKNATLQAPAAQALSVQADWMVVGDPPDEGEDRSGRPFVDQAGMLLDNMLKAVGVSRTATGAHGAYLANVVKCRPPQGRNPQGGELAQCASFLNREIALVQPKIILAMGRFANQLLLNEQPALANLPLGKLRGVVYRYQGVPVVVTYHPKALLRSSADKAKAWADLCLAMQVLEAP